jgi:hypothetical protein
MNPAVVGGLKIELVHLGGRVIISSGTAAEIALACNLLLNAVEKVELNHNCHVTHTTATNAGTAQPEAKGTTVLISRVFSGVLVSDAQEPARDN